MLPEHLTNDRQSRFPNLRKEDYKLTSEQDWNYNCIAHTVNDTGYPWWPTEEAVEGVFWPQGIPREETLEAFVAAYQTRGYELCSELNVDLENGVEKIVIYVDAQNRPTHAARQLPCGSWTSKLGEWEDIEHYNLTCLQGGDYGTICKVLRRAAVAASDA